MTTQDMKIPVTRLQLDKRSGVLTEAPLKELFLRGPIPMEWLSKAANLTGKTFHLAIVLWWLKGMAKTQPFKLTRKALGLIHISRDAASDGLNRLEEHGLVAVERKAGQRPAITILA